MDVLGQAGEELLNEAIRHVEGRLEHLVREGLQQLAGVDGLRLIDGQVLRLHLTLTLRRLGLPAGIGLLNQRSVSVIVHHAQRLHLAELPIGRISIRPEPALRVRLGVGSDTLIERQKDAQHGHAHRHIVHPADGLRQLRPHVQDMRLRGAEDGDGAILFLRVVVQVGVVLRALIVESEGAAQIV